MRRLAPLLVLVLVAAACGGSKHAATTTQAAAPPSPTSVLPGGKALYVGGPWAVVVRGRKAVAAHLVDGTWRPDTSGAVKVDVIAPHGRAVPIPQVAAEMKAPARLVEEGLWIDGQELLEKGGGLKPTNVTIYGAPDAKLKPGPHVGVAYGRTDASGTAVAWVFTVV